MRDLNPYHGRVNLTLSVPITLHQERITKVQGGRRTKSEPLNPGYGSTSRRLLIGPYKLIYKELSASFEHVVSKGSVPNHSGAITSYLLDLVGLKSDARPDSPPLWPMLLF